MRRDCSRCSPRRDQRPAFTWRFFNVPAVRTWCIVGPDSRHLSTPGTKRKTNTEGRRSFTFPLSLSSLIWCLIAPITECEPNPDLFVCNKQFVFLPLVCYASSFWGFFTFNDVMMQSSWVLLKTPEPLNGLWLGVSRTHSHWGDCCGHPPQTGCSQHLWGVKMNQNQHCRWPEDSYLRNMGFHYAWRNNPQAGLLYTWCLINVVIPAKRTKVSRTEWIKMNICLYFCLKYPSFIDLMLQSNFLRKYFGVSVSVSIII